jgi:hypothetical protein
MTKEEFLSSFSDQSLMDEIVILKDIVSLKKQGYSDDEIQASYGFTYDTPEDDLAVLEEEAVKRGLIKSKSTAKIITKEILIALLVGFSAYALLKN